ncbi:MAG TPA: hypothetical protein VL614_26480 [Acetobacteraceae bacterium]|nr:hypothetical protein [Acetobacteraceae bacterium]
MERLDDADLDWDVLDEAPLPIELPITFTRGLDTEDDCEPEDVLTVVVLFDPEVDVWA